jgi:hypothetical protein
MEEGAIMSHTQSETMLRRPETDAGFWQPRRRVFLAPSLAIALLSLALVLAPELNGAPAWVRHVTPLWGLAGALLAGILGRVRLRREVVLNHPSLAGIAGGLAALMLMAGVAEWPGGL